MLTNAQKVRIRKWIRMLESGEFKQGRGKLKKEGKYCCLGVACELYSVEVGGFWKVAPDYPMDREKQNHFVADYTNDGEDGEPGDEDESWTDLPIAVRNWLGLSVADTSRLVDMNDTFNASFKEIAAKLRKALAINEERGGEGLGVSFLDK